MAIRQEDIDACRNISEFGVNLIRPDSTLLTHCHTGALATAGGGTALFIVIEAHRRGLVRRVYVDETRPLLQGARLTSWELMQNGVDAVLVTDSTAGFLMQRGGIDAVLVGADRITANGDVANKIGTYSLAVLAAYHKIPFYVAAPVSTLDFETPTGSQITIEERNPDEVTRIRGVRVAPEGVAVYAPAFDVTPNELVTAIVTDAGILRPPFHEALAELKAQFRGTIALHDRQD
jgi:methylthioribose-1-phosphate isomerase